MRYVDDQIANDLIQDIKLDRRYKGTKHPYRGLTNSDNDLIELETSAEVEDHTWFKEIKDFLENLSTTTVVRWLIRILILTFTGGGL